MNVLKNANAEEVYSALAHKINLSPEAFRIFALFEIVEYNFGELSACPDACTLHGRVFEMIRVLCNFYRKKISTE